MSGGKDSIGALACLSQACGRLHANPANRLGHAEGGVDSLRCLAPTLTSIVLIVFIGFGLIQMASASNTIIQSLVPEDKSGRIMSYHIMAFVGAAPFGALFAGVLAEKPNAPHPVLFCGVC